MKNSMKRRVGGRIYEAPVRTVLDDESGEATFTLEEGRRAELDIACQVATSAPPTAEGFNWMRRALALTGRELGKLLGVRFETVSRWERGEVPVDRGAWILVGGLVLERAGRPVDLLHRMQATPVQTKKRARG